MINIRKQKNSVTKRTNIERLNTAYFNIIDKLPFKTNKDNLINGNGDKK